MRKAFAKFSKAMSGEGNPVIAPPRLNPEDLAFLHGKIFVEVFEARNVEGKDSSAFSKLERAFVSSMDGVDPYCSVKLGYNTVFMTPVIDNDPNPVWNVSAELDVAHELDALEFRLKAAKRKGPLSIISKVKHLSMLSIPATEILEKREIDGWFPLQTYRKEITAENPYDDDSSDTSESEDEEVPESSLGDIRIRVVYTPIHELDLSQVGLLKSYYPPRECVNNQLYQDADCPPGSIPEIPTYPDYRHGRCWVDLAQAIMESTEIIYITGWAVWPELVMVRTDYPGDQWKGKTLGEMLKKKAEDGVTVCVLVWDEVASNRFSKGIMGTHDEELIHYFRRSKVHAAKVPRQNLKDGPFADLNDSLMFTHHQKTVIVSRFDSVTHKNRLEAYVGGLDLTDGRYDNNEHSLFRTLKGVHAPPDFWQACATGVQATAGPREPWHDIHSKVTGAAAWDILENFESRWKGQLSERKHSALHPCSPDIFVTAEEEQYRQDGNWTVQILRSINQSSAVLDETRPGLITRRKASIDQSIHNAYIHQIRRAKSYIYIENQYFLGSSHMWDSKQRGGFSSHLVAIELAEKICAKIRANERFAVYVVVPMYPEGPPDSGAVQEILAHQRKTVSVITSRITATIRECGIDSSIGDWFNMFCLVNRESSVGGQGDGGQTDLEMTLHDTRRFMIYVHSKFAIFDDAVAITGSANINSRSMDGSRDSEIAAMSWQPEHTSSGSTGYGEGAGEPSVIPKGDVAAFRTALMMEHLGHYFYEMEDPASLECVHKICDLAKQNWEHFAADSEEPGDMPHGHLAYYPYMYDPETGETLSSVPTFPDFDGALVKGQSSVIPNMLTG